MCDHGLCDHAWSGMGGGQGGRMFCCCLCAESFANRHHCGESTPRTLPAADGGGCSSQPCSGRRDAAQRAALHEQRSTGVATASGTGDAADASRSRWGLQQPAVQRAAPCSSTHAPQTPGAADWASAATSAAGDGWSCCRCAHRPRCSCDIEEAAVEAELIVAAALKGVARSARIHAQ